MEAVEGREAEQTNWALCVSSKIPRELRRSLGRDLRLGSWVSVRICVMNQIKDPLAVSDPSGSLTLPGSEFAPDVRTYVQQKDRPFRYILEEVRCLKSVLTG